MIAAMAERDTVDVTLFAAVRVVAAAVAAATTLAGILHAR